MQYMTLVSPMVKALVNPVISFRTSFALYLDFVFMYTLLIFTLLFTIYR